MRIIKAMATSPQSQRSLSDVVQDIIANLQQIIRSEMRLATVEIKEKTDQAKKPATTLAIGGVLGLYGVGFVLLASMYALSLVLAPWLAALIVGVVLAIVATILVGSGRKSLKKIQALPEKTVQSVKENVQWSKEQIK